MRLLHELQVHEVEVEMQNEELRRAQAQLGVSLARYFELYDLAPVGYLTLNPEGRILEANLRSAILLGVPRSNLLKQPLTNFVLPEDQDVYHLHRQQLSRSVEPHECELRMRREGGPPFWARLHATVGQETTSHSLVCRIVMSDVTQRKRAEEGLREGEAKYRHLYEGLRDAFVSVSMDGRIQEFNRAYQEMLGYTAEELGRLTYLDVTPEKWRNLEARIVAEQVVPRGFSDVYEKEYRRKDGTVFPVELRTVLLRDQEGHPSGMWAIVRDITERKQAQEEHERLATAIEQAAEAIMITDMQGAIQYVNPAFEAVTGYTRAEVLGQNPRLLKSGQQDAAFYRDLWATIRGGKTWQGRFVNRKKDGTHYTEEATISPVRDTSSAIVNYVAVKRDITHELALEAQLLQAQKMESVGRLAGGVAHDFNNMLQAILGNVELAKTEVAPGSKLQTRLVEIERAAQRSANLTRQLLAFARKQTVAPQVLDLNETVAAMLAMLRRLIGEHIALTWAPGPGLWPVKMDPAQLDQVLANLVVNAGHAISGSGQIAIETAHVTFDEAGLAGRPDVVPGDYVVLTVTDNGCGMPREVLEHIFEPFYTTKSQGKGTGLGLATVYGVVKQNDGFIAVSSEEGKGTTFRIGLPRAAGEVKEAETVSTEEAPRARGETVLLVEDETAVLRLGQALLTDLGYSVLTAATPDEALRQAQTVPGKIALLLTDVVMPGMNGRELSERLQAIRPQTKCLFMSGHTADVIAYQGVLDEGVQFIQKPFTLSNLATKVRAALQQP